MALVRQQHSPLKWKGRLVLPDARVQTGGAPVQMGPVGFWLDKDGNVAATDPSGQTQITPGQRDNPQGQLYYDSSRDLYYNLVGGQKQYQSPYSYAGAAGANSNAKGTGNGMLQTMDKGGGAFHGQPTWNGQKGAFDVKLDWGKVGSMIVGGVLTAGALDVALGSGAAATALSAPAGTTGSTAAVGATAATGAATTAATGAGAAAAVPGAAAGAAGAAAPSVLKSAPSWLSPVLNYGVPLAGQLIGTTIASNANTEAAKIAAESVEKALAFEKEKYAYEQGQYGSYLGRLQPFIGTGTSANAREAELLGLPSSSVSGPSSVGPPQRGPGETTMPASEPNAPFIDRLSGAATTPTGPVNRPASNQQRMVMMQAPDGSTKQVPASEREHWLRAGAKEVSNPQNIVWGT